MNTIAKFGRIGLVAAAAVAFSGTLLASKPAEAWGYYRGGWGPGWHGGYAPGWRGGWRAGWGPGYGWRRGCCFGPGYAYGVAPYVVAPSVVVAGPPVYRRAWIPAHWNGPYWVPGHWA